MLSLRIFKRDINKKPDLYRKEKKIPGIVYGPNLESFPVYAEEKEFLKVYKEYESGLIEIIFDSQKFQGLIQEVQVHPLTEKIIHFDIFVPSQKEKIKTKVPLKFVGVAPGVQSGGVLSINLEEIEIECLPKDIPPYFEINLEKLINIGDSIYIKDLKVPPEIKILFHPETPIVSLIKEAETLE